MAQAGGKNAAGIPDAIAKQLRYWTSNCSSKQSVSIPSFGEKRISHQEDGFLLLQRINLEC